MATPTQIADRIKKVQLEQIQEGLDEVEGKLKKLEPYIQLRNQLRSAQRALLGTGNRTTGSGGTQVTQDQVAAYLREHPGSGLREVADAIDPEKYNAINNHLVRGRGERFLQHPETKLWFVRDPKNDLNTVEDIDDWVENNDKTAGSEEDE